MPVFQLFFSLLCVALLVGRIILRKNSCSRVYFGGSGNFAVCNDNWNFNAWILGFDAWIICVFLFYRNLFGFLLNEADIRHFEPPTHLSKYFNLPLAKLEFVFLNFGDHSDHRYQRKVSGQVLQIVQPRDRKNRWVCLRVVRSLCLDAVLIEWKFNNFLLC
jgi:hypothetical protein